MASDFFISFLAILIAEFSLFENPLILFSSFVPIIPTIPLFYRYNNSSKVYHIIRGIMGIMGLFSVKCKENSSWSTVSMSHLSLKSKLPDPIDRYCIYILSYPSMSITLCINHIIRFFLLKNILHGLTLVLPCFHLYRIRLLRPQ